MTESTTPRRVVIDTNLVLSALVFAQGRLTVLRLAWQQQRIQPLICQETAAELMRVLNYPKFKLTGSDQEELLADYLPYCLSITIPSPPPITPDCRDKFDLQFLQLAIAGQADALVTGDQDLLTITEPFICPILTAEQFLQTLNS